MLLRIITFIVAAVLSAGLASADIVFSMVPTGPTTVVQGTSVTVELRATDPDGVQIGLPSAWLGFNARILADTADANDAPIQALGPKFIAPPVPPLGATDDFNSADGRTFAGIGTAMPLADNDVLASFTYIADVVGTTTFRFNTADQAFTVAEFDTALFDTANNLFAGGTASITVTAVPEPSTFALLSLGGVGLVVARRRRTKTQSA